MCNVKGPFYKLLKEGARNTPFIYYLNLALRSEFGSPGIRSSQSTYMDGSSYITNTYYSKASKLHPSPSPDPH